MRKSQRLVTMATVCVGITAALGGRAYAQDGWNINWAFNLNPGIPSAPIPPHPFESDHGWRGGAQPQDIVDGFRGCNGPGGWQCRLAFTAGDSGWAGEPCGVRQATINLGDAPVQVSAVRITHHSDEHVPVIYQIQTWDGSNWSAQVSITDNSKGRCVRAPSYNPNTDWTCMITDEFAPVATTKVRYTFNNCPSQNTSILGRPIVHGWLWEFEVYRLP